MSNVLSARAWNQAQNSALPQIFVQLFLKLLAVILQTFIHLHRKISAYALLENFEDSFLFVNINQMKSLDICKI